MKFIKDIVNYKMLIQYDGGRYYGWEHQPNTDMTIQGKLEAVLTRMLRLENEMGESDFLGEVITGVGDSLVEVIGAGRTDAGVHALGMTANVKMNTKKTEEEIVEYMNHYLPEDIVILKIERTSDRFHARYNACGKIYRYRLYKGNKKPLFNRKYVYDIRNNDIMPGKANRSGNGILDIDKMREAAGLLLGKHDFASFCGNPKMKKSTVREIYSIKIEESMDGDYLDMIYHGTGFLQYMVRILSGTLIEVGKGNIKPQDINRILEAKNRVEAGPTAPAQGLTLLKVEYLEGF